MPFVGDARAQSERAGSGAAGGVAGDTDRYHRRLGVRPPVSPSVSVTPCRYVWGHGSSTHRPAPRHPAIRSPDRLLHLGSVGRYLSDRPGSLSSATSGGAAVEEAELDDGGFVVLVWDDVGGVECRRLHTRDRSVLTIFAHRRSVTRAAHRCRYGRAGGRRDRYLERDSAHGVDVLVVLSAQQDRTLLGLD
jgi:hypothetical protein